MKDLNVRLHSLAIFRNLLKDPVIAALCDFLQQTQEVSAVSAYAQFVAELYRMEKRTLAGHIQSIVGRDENAYIRLIGRGFADDICCAFYPFCHVRIPENVRIIVHALFPVTIQCFVTVGI